MLYFSIFPKLKYWSGMWLQTLSTSSEYILILFRLCNVQFSVLRKKNVVIYYYYSWSKVVITNPSERSFILHVVVIRCKCSTYLYNECTFKTTSNEKLSQSRKLNFKAPKTFSDVFIYHRFSNFFSLFPFPIHLCALCHDWMNFLLNICSNRSNLCNQIDLIRTNNVKNNFGTTIKSHPTLMTLDMDGNLLFKKYSKLCK